MCTVRRSVWAATSITGEEDNVDMDTGTVQGGREQEKNRLTGGGGPARHPVRFAACRLIRVPCTVPAVERVETGGSRTRSFGTSQRLDAALAGSSPAPLALWYSNN